MNDRRGNWYLLTGLVLGLVMGLVYAWLVRPLQFSDTSPAMLSPAEKDRYRVLIASAYLANRDLVRAEARLRLLEDEDPFQALAEQAQRTLSGGSDAEAARALGVLAVDLGNRGAPASNAVSPSPTLQPVSPGAGTILTPTATLAPPPETPAIPPTAAATQAAPASDFTPPPTRTPTATPGAPFVLEERKAVCDPTLTEALIQVQVQDAAGQPVPGVEVLISWEDEQERIFTGLKPELGLGYADFTIASGLTYAVRLAEGGEPVNDLAVQECEAPSGGKYWGSWLLSFTQP
jgi:hypothetical protein